MNVDAIVQSIYVSLLVPKGSFEPDRELGSDLPKLSTEDWGLFCFEFERIFKEVLLDFDDVKVLGLEFKKDKKVVAKLLVGSAEERDLEFDFGGRQDGKQPKLQPVGM